MPKIEALIVAILPSFLVLMNIRSNNMKIIRQITWKLSQIIWNSWRWMFDIDEWMDNEIYDYGYVYIYIT